MSPCISLNRAKHSGGFLPRTGGGRRLGVSCPCPVLGSLVTSPPKRHRWAFVGRLPHPRSSSLGPVPPPLPGLGSCEGPSRPAAVARPGQRAPVPRRAPCCTPHTPSPTELLAVGGGGFPAPVYRCEEGRAQVPGPRGAASREQGRALPLARARRQRGFGVSRTAGFPPHAPPDLRPAGGRGVGRSSPPPPPALCPPGWAATGASCCKEQVKGSHA